MMTGCASYDMCGSVSLCLFPRGAYDGDRSPDLEGKNSISATMITTEKGVEPQGFSFHPGKYGHGLRAGVDLEGPLGRHIFYSFLF